MRAIKRATFLLLCATGMAWMHTPASAQTFPAKPIRLIVGFAPGGPNDIISRALAARLTESLAQTVTVENRTGAGGNLAAELVARAAPDGHTLMLGSTGTNSVNPALYSKMSFDLVKDLTPVTQVASGSSALAVNPKVAARSVRELIALAKAQPGRLTFASSGGGSSLHLAGELFKQMAGVDMIHVPYKGAQPAVTDLLSGQVDMSFAPATNVVPHAKSGKLVLLGVTGLARSAYVPDVPTLAESGVPGFDVTTWYGIFAPTGTPDAVLMRLHTEIAKAMQSTPVREQLLNIGIEVALSASPSAFQAYRSAEVEKWGRLVRAAGVKVE